MVDAPSRTITHTGNGVSLVPLSNRGSGSLAVVDTDDLHMVESLGLSLRWTRHPKSGVVVAPASLAAGGHVTVARVLLDALPGQNVKFIDGDPTNLRRSNLSLIPGNSVRRDREYLTVKAKRRGWGPEIRQVYLKEEATLEA